MDAAAEGQDDFTIVAVPEKNRYEMRDGEKVAGFADYILTPDQVVFTHTVVDEAYGGRGLGSKLAKHVLDDAASTGKRIVPVCSFIAAYVRKHHDWDEHLEPSGSAPSN
jgi:predicted GNAT family acetyltransferase